MAEVTNVRVALRCRPLSKKELGEGDVSVFEKDGSMAKLKTDEKDAEFAFDHVYDWKSTQEEVFNDVGQPVCDAAFDGFNATVFAYGQTGSGKSWSMTGNLGSEKEKGLIPRINDALFQRIDKECETGTRKFLVQVSYFEIYNEILYDLLDPRPRKEKEKGGGLQIKEHPVLGIHVPGLQRLVATDAAKVMDFMELGAKNRSVGATQMNAESSRSHSVCLLNVHQKDSNDESRNVFSKLNLVDLAGSERADRTGATGSRLKEGANINKSLSTLGSVINGLVEKASGKKKGVFIPYRDSKLTRVLQESLGGNSLCTMLATLSPAKLNAKETLSTLRYAARAKTIKVSVTKNEEASQISLLNEEVAKLKKLLAEKTAERSDDPTQSAPVIDTEAVRVAEEKLAQQIAETEALTRQTWEEKQLASKAYEEELTKMKKATKDAARRADAERRRRFQLLKDKADVELSVKELALPGRWADAARHVRNLETRTIERRSHVGVFRDALAADILSLRDTPPQDDVVALCSVKRGAAEAVEARVGLLVKELAKLDTDEESLRRAAEDLVSNVDSALLEDDPRKKERIKLVLDQATHRRDGLRRDAALSLASVIKDDAHSDLSSMAKDLALEIAALPEIDPPLEKAKVDLETVAKTALDAATALRDAVSSDQPQVGKKKASRVGPSSASSGDPSDSWHPVADDKDPWLLFELEAPAQVTLHVQPGRVAPVTSSQSKIDGADRKLTVELLSSVISWTALRLKPEKAEKLLGRPPVRFLTDVFSAIDASAPAGWLQKAPRPDDDRRVFFGSLVASLKGTLPDIVRGDDSVDIGGFVTSPDAILAGQSVDGTNALVQALAIAALRAKENWTTKPTKLRVDVFADGQWSQLGELPVDDDGRCALPEKAITKCKVWPIAWQKHGDSDSSSDALQLACRIQLSGSSEETSDLNEATERLAAEISTVREAMVRGVAAVVAATRSAAQKASREQKAAAEKERGKAAELQAEVDALKEKTEALSKALKDKEQEIEAANAQCEDAKYAAQTAEDGRLAAEAKQKKLEVAVKEVEEKWGAEKASHASQLEALTTKKCEESEAAREEAKKANDDAVSHFKEKIESAETELNEARTKLDEAMALKDRAEHKTKGLEDKLAASSKLVEEAQQKAERDVEEARTKILAAEKEARAARAEKEAALETAQEESTRLEQKKLEQQTAQYELESDLDAVKAQLETTRSDLEAARDAQNAAEANIAETTQQRDDAVKSKDELELALRVAEEERDAAREKEVLLSNDMETLKEDLDNSSEGYVNLSNRLADVSDELAETRERLEEYVEKDQIRAKEFLQANANVESEALQQAAQASKEARRAYNEAQKAQQDSDSFRTAVVSAREALHTHLADRLPKDLAPTRLSDDSTPALVDVLTTLVSTVLEHNTDLSRRLAIAERPPEVADVSEASDNKSSSSFDHYDDDFE